MNNNKSILIVEDEKIVAEDMEMRLQSLGYTVVGKTVSSEQTLSFVKKKRPDLILMDIKLKGKINGIKTAGILKDGYDIPVVYVTAYADKENLVSIKETEPFGIISKPFDDKDLINVIETALYKYKIERRLKESKENLRTTLNSISDAVISTDNKGKIVSMNSMAEYLTEWKISEAKGKPLTAVFNIVHMETREKCDNPVEKVLKYGKMVNLSNQTLLISRYGNEYPIADSGSPILYDNGSIRGVVLVFRDITEEYKMQQELYENEERLSAIYNSSQTVIIVSTIEEGRIIEVNNAFTSLTGWEPEEAIGQTSLNLGIWAEPAERQRQMLTDELRKNGQVKNQEFVFKNRNGDRITGLLSAEIIQIRGENYILVNVVNVTERKKIEKEKDRYLRELKFITDTVIEISRMDDIEEMCRSLGKTIHSVNTESYVIVLLYDPETDALRIRALIGFDKVKDDLLRISGKDITSVFLIPEQLPEKINKYYTIGKLKYVSNSLCFLLDKKFKKEMCQKIERLLGIEKVYTVGFPQDDLPYGGITILTSSDYTIQYQSAIETLVTHFSVLIHRKQMKEVLWKSKERYKNFIEQSFEGIYRQELEKPVDITLPVETQIDLLYDNSYVAECNQAMAEMYQLRSTEDLIGQRMVDLHGGKNNPVNRAIVRKFIESNYRIKDEETMETLNDGSIVYFSNNTIGIIDNGYLIRMWGTQLDITERKTIDEQIKKDLEEKNILLKEIHHRVKNNLQIIRSLIHIQLTDGISPEFKASATELSNRILSMAMIHEQLYGSENLSQINLKFYLESLINNILQSYTHSHITIKKKIEELYLPIDKSIPVGLMVNELITNAVKHAFPENREGYISITLIRKQKLCEIKVKDNGIGMPGKINFQNPSTLGLKLVNILAKQLEGKVRVYRRKGTSIKCIFSINGM
ncbi:MAG: PAS domain S-box protein [bacterium]